MLGEAEEVRMRDMVIATNPGDGIRITLYTRGGAVARR